MQATPVAELIAFTTVDITDMGRNQQDDAFDGAAVKLARHFYNRTPRLRKCRSATNYCVVLHFDGEIADRVLKLTNHNRWAIEVERCLFPAMRARGLPVPEIEHTHLDYPEPSEPFLVMPKFSDLTLDNLCYHDTEPSRIACLKAGQFIHTLHDRFADVFSSYLSLEDVSGQLNAIQEGTDGGPDLSPIRRHHPELLPIIERHSQTLTRPTKRRLTHGAFHTDNIVATAQGDICAIDLGESICMSSPLRDLFSLLCSHDGYSIGTGHSEQRKALIAGYGGVGDADIQELLYWEFNHYVGSLRGHLPIPGLGEYKQGLVDSIRRIADGESPLLVHCFS